jgi:predicted DNA-binding helix-hairpin-helix protein
MSTLPLEQRLEILADSAKYDVSCSSSGSSRAGKAGNLGSTAASGICHTWTADGRCISLLKILLTNACIFTVPTVSTVAPMTYPEPLSALTRSLL